MALRLVYYAASRGIATLSNLDMQQCPKTFCNNVQKYFAILSKKCLQKTNKNLVEFLHNLFHWQGSHLTYQLVNFLTFMAEFLPAGFPLYSELPVLSL